MTFVSLGDLAQSFQLRSHNARLKADLQTYAQELSSGRKSDLSRALGGDFSALSGVERALSNIGAFRTSATEAALFAETQQNALGAVEADLQDLSARFLSTATLSQPSFVDNVGAEARTRLAGMIDRLNGSVAGRALFGGAATDRPAFADAETILADVEASLGPVSTAADVEAAVRVWFAPGGAYDSQAYQGSASPLAPWRVAPDTSVALSASGLDPGIRAGLESLAMAALLDLGVLSGQPEERRALARAAGEAALSAQDALLATRARIGTAEESISEARASNEAEQSALEVARTRLIGSDPYEAATRLQETEAQLQTLYTLTARLSRLSLTDYLR